ncbi:helix-turn-helix domain-containing protein [Pelagibacterium limicola]|uniref:helix-turn-helix domain-containing protein n=1 Tax=Pelagibacterium limicola TaxID=2791022 RepID=UPI0018AFC0CD|nr:helix-turn-helix domain-containing protein [Pelagibacterium limicola]
MTSYRPVVSVMRSFEVLEALNRQRYSTVDHLYRLTGLPKSTIVRLLETLIEAGYVVRDDTGKGYQVASQVNALSCGFHGAPQVVEAGRAWAQELTRMFNWPAAIAVLDRNAVQVCYTTSGESPVAPYHALIYKRLGLVSKALGRAYFAFCPAGERRLIHRLLLTTSHPDNDQMGAPDAIEQIMRATRKQQFAERQSCLKSDTSASIAVPIYQQATNRVLGTIGLTYYASAVKRSEIMDKLVPNLMVAAEAVSDNVARMQTAIQSARTVVH